MRIRYKNIFKLMVHYIEIQQRRDIVHKQKKKKYIVCWKILKVVSLTVIRCQKQKGEKAEIHVYLLNNFLHCMIIAANVYMTVELTVNIRGSFEQWGNIAFVAKSAALSENNENMRLGKNAQETIICQRILHNSNIQTQLRYIVLALALKFVSEEQRETPSL